MANVVEDIKTQILTVRQDLRHNLDEVEDRVKEFVDWRHAYRAHTGLILGCAALGGFLVAHHFASKTRRVAGDSQHDSLDHAGAQPVLTHIRDNVSQIQTALVNVAAAHAKRLLGKWIPGFADHLPDT